ncbi:hypothetical protein E1A91_D07G127200v1 [Gossypium mustelinum]|uniref:Uncharacterized protein n=5 Tax=Gossypium TaxID=3633 RepID=A0A0D2QFR0_GOSRA|nr:uncharacterized protein LOC105792914 isoform X2 [Gossypium raimondii]KAB2021211.1 hypothetical protein ES319_D07G123400v1 [Gossypium barbadense]TYG61228.1 hypothetical protein ES288_D07G130600v1 [Gossypium darwinii]TYH62574.1 hypothetical protein ES332_D07G129400v1 [Gossypium tomentosum]TYI73401.1 hypothetical protein E1A91_D07G127200v1 [Gossypium mustelinum]KJB06205.1 hypothetical protein B456_001G124000 [Gossypium raimondii]
MSVNTFTVSTQIGLLSRPMRPICFCYIIMGNKPAKQERREEVLLKIVPPLDQAYVRWLARDIERIHGFSPRNPRAVKPPEHYIEYMQLNGWLDVDLDDPDLAHLFK